MNTYAYDVVAQGHGKVLLNIQRPNIQPLSKVFASVCEFKEVNKALTPFVGDARMYICNIAPAEGSVQVWVNVDWGSDLNLFINLLVVNP
jgi:hypothetical protein